MPRCLRPVRRTWQVAVPVSARWTRPCRRHRERSAALQSRCHDDPGSHRPRYRTDRLGGDGLHHLQRALKPGRSFKALDIMCHGRAGWNAVTSSGEDVAANYGQRIPSSSDRYGRAHETVQLVQALWGSWGKDAWVLDVEKGQFANEDQIQPINRGGKYVASRGPLYIPLSEQGQPVAFHAGGSPNAHALAGRFASVVIGATFMIEDARDQRTVVPQRCRAGRPRSRRNQVHRWPHDHHRT